MRHLASVGLKRTGFTGSFPRSTGEHKAEPLGRTISDAGVTVDSRRRQEPDNFQDSSCAVFPRSAGNAVRGQTRIIFRKCEPLLYSVRDGRGIQRVLEISGVRPGNLPEHRYVAGNNR